jgi:hypothetical protein
MISLGSIGTTVTIVTGLIVIGDRVAKFREKNATDGNEWAGWSLLRVRRSTIAAAIVGIAVYVGIQGIIGSSSQFYGPITLISLSQTTVLVVGVWYGPWAGIATAAIGYPLTVVWSIHDYHGPQPGVVHMPFPPAYSVGDGLVGLTGGLLIIYLGSEISKPTNTDLIISAGIAAIAVVLGDLLSYAISQHQHLAVYSSTLSKGIVSDVLCVVVALPFALKMRPAGALELSRQTQPGE